MPIVSVTGGAIFYYCLLGMAHVVVGYRNQQGEALAYFYDTTLRP
ncbi:MAG: hypothetical protein ORN57_03830 [Alphaproteobacteria bacterium]|nr:hypothetical protein [Alphaproteobacteria bacterium]